MSSQRQSLAKSTGKSIAQNYTARFESLIDRLAEYPDSYARCRGLGKDIRIGIVFPYLVIYRHREADDTVMVRRVVHGRRELTVKSISD
jgi:toxin ParE1/3/4